jgi:hypothetical protein
VERLEDFEQVLQTGETNVASGAVTSGQLICCSDAANNNLSRVCQIFLGATYQNGKKIHKMTINVYKIT